MKIFGYDFSFSKIKTANIENPVKANPSSNQQIPFRILLEQKNTGLLTNQSDEVIEYCQNSSQSFIQQAGSWAMKLTNLLESKEKHDRFVRNCHYALRDLVEGSDSKQQTTIFKTDLILPFTEFTPDYIQLGLTPERLKVSEDKLMTVITLVISLWNILANNQISRDCSDNSESNFNIYLDHCRYGSLINESGWLKYAIKQPYLLENGLAPAGLSYIEPFDQSKLNHNQQLLNDHFRKPTIIPKIRSLLENSQ